MCFSLTLIHYGKPIISVYILVLSEWILQEIAYMHHSPVRVFNLFNVYCVYGVGEP